MSRHVTIPAEFIGLLGTMSDGNLGRLAGINRTTITWRRNALGIVPFTPPLPVWHADLATATDREIVMRYGVERRVVYRMREAAGLPKNGGFAPNFAHLTALNDSRKVDLTAVVPYLGTASDKSLSIRFAVSAELIRRERVRRRIPVNTRESAPVAPKHEPEPPPNAPVRRSVVTPSAPIECTFDDRCLCPECRRSRMIEERQRRVNSGGGSVGTTRA